MNKTVRGVIFAYTLFAILIDSAVERGLTNKPLDPDAVVDFAYAKEVGS